MYWNDYGLLNPTSKDRISENCLLTTEVYQRLLPDPIKEVDSHICDWIQECWTGTEGLFNQAPFMRDNKDDYMSPDQLIAMGAFLKRIGDDTLINDIAKYLRKHLSNYNNLQDDKIRLMQPSAYLFLQILDGHFEWPFKLVLKYILRLSCKKPREVTSGKQKAWLIASAIDPKWVTDLEPLVGCWEDVFRVYYKESDHPIRLLIDRTIQ